MIFTTGDPKIIATQAVAKELADYHLAQLFTTNQLKDIARGAQRNMRVYHMQSELAARDAIANTMMEEQIEIPPSYLKRFWFA